MESVPKSGRTFEMMKQILKAGPNQMETLRRLGTEAAAIDKDLTVRSERIRQTRDFRIRFWFRKKTMERGSLHHSIRIHHTQARAATKRAEWHVRRSASLVLDGSRAQAVA